MDTPVLIPIRFADHRQPVRDVAWVLRWAATLAVLALAAVILLEFGYRLRAERAMLRAAEAGVREAALPRADRRSVERAARGRLDARLCRGTQVLLKQGVAQISVALSAPVDAALPDWLQLVTFWNSRAEISVRAGG